MCKYCSEHGQGKKWFLNMSNYSKSLFEDSERELFFKDFVKTVRGKTPLSKIALMYELKKATSKITGPGSLDEFYSMFHLGQVVSNTECFDVLNLSSNEVAVLDCYCRKKYGKESTKCCLGVGLFSDYIKTHLDSTEFKLVSPEEAKELVINYEKNNKWFHSIWTLKTPFIAYLCNCDGKYCTGIQKYHNGIQMMIKGHYVSHTDSSKCNGCGKCVSVCAFGGRIMNRENLPIVNDNCFGCGVCASHCDAKAITLVEKKSEH